MSSSDQQTRVAFVTGAGGFLGGAVAAGLAAAGWKVAGLGHAARHPGDRPAPDFIEGEVTRAALERAAVRVGSPHLVFHAAGGASVAASVEDPARDRKRTLGSLRQVLDYLRDEAPHARLIYPSSAAVYGDAGPGPIPETAPLKPVSPYGRHKLMAEDMILEEHAARGLDTTIIRFFSAYGPGLRKQLFWELAHRLAAGPAAIDLAGTGEEARDFIYVDDAVALVRLLSAKDPGAGPLIVNGGTGEAVSVRQAASALGAALGSQTRIQFNGSVRSGDPAILVADIAVAKAFGFEPKTSLKAAVERLASWLTRA